MRHIKLLAIVIQCVIVPSVSADSDRFPAVTYDVTRKECGACHMTFQPQLLPARSWEAIMDNLNNHFGEDAGLDQETTDYIEEYLVKNAADTRRNGFRDYGVLQGIKNSQTPIRITDLPYWIHEHTGELSPTVWKRTDIGSKANCLACHSDADQGYYEDD